MSKDFMYRSGDDFNTIGDYLGRAPAIDLLNPKSKEKVLDAGCGTGWCSRKIVKSGAEVWACDREQKVIDYVIKYQGKNSHGINYSTEDICKLPYSSNFFDKVFCAATLMYDSPLEITKFLKEAWRVLVKDGKLLISITHPFLCNPNAPTRTKKAKWIQFFPLENKPISKSQKIRELYLNSYGDIFETFLWHHPEKLFFKLLNKAGFQIIKRQDTYLTRQITKKKSPLWEKEKIGYPVYFQILATKGE